MIRTSPGIRQIALEHFNGRLTAARKLAREMGDSWPGDPANENLRLWLAIALAAGVGRDLPREVCAAIEVEAIYPHRKMFLPSAEAFCRSYGIRWENVLAELADARDAALARSEKRVRDLRAEQKARDLIALADALGAPPIDWSTFGQGRAAA